MTDFEYTDKISRVIMAFVDLLDTRYKERLRELEVRIAELESEKARMTSPGNDGGPMNALKERVDG